MPWHTAARRSAKEEECRAWLTLGASLLNDTATSSVPAPVCHVLVVDSCILVANSLASSILCVVSGVVAYLPKF